MKSGCILSALIVSLGLVAPAAHALDFGTAVGGGVGAVAGAVIGDSVGGHHGAIVGSGVGGIVGAVVGHSVSETGYRHPHSGYYAPPPVRVIEYHYHPYPIREYRPRGHAWGHHKHHHHRRHEHRYRGYR